MSISIKINSQLDPQKYAAELQQNGRVQINNFFEKDSANYLLQLMQQNKHWNLAYNEGNQYFESSMAEFEGLAPQFKHRLMNNVYSRARTQFQYCFIQYYISQAFTLNEQPGHAMHQMHEFMNADSTLTFMRQLTQQNDINSADTYASCYSPGHFLTEHDDRHNKHDRVAAYVFSMNEVWDKNWGGHLAFFDDSGNIKEAYIPSFNTLNLFFIPVNHAVQLVSPFAGASRLSYSGWLHR